MILSDNETSVDFLNNEAIAQTIVKLLRESPTQPVTLGVHGDWGAGKSSILKMIEAALKQEEKVLCVSFNGWRFQGFEDAKIALMEGIVTGLLEERPGLRRAADAVKDVFKRINWLKVAKTGGGLAFTALTGVPTPGQIGTVAGAMRGWLSAPEKLATKESIESAIADLDGLLKQSTAKHVPEEVLEFQKAFAKLLEEADVEQLVVLIDDLDRCLPETAIQTLEAIRLFVFTERTAFVVAADEAMIEYAVRKHFPEMPDVPGQRDYARNYLEKLIQVPFRTPSLGEAETRIYVTLLLIGVTIGEEDDGFEKLVSAARELLRRPWTGKVLDFAAVKGALGGRAGEVKEMLTLSDQVGPILASGSKGNPRQIKRFLNAVLLRQRIAESRGFGQEVTMPVLAKLMLAERFMPSVFDQIAGIAAGASDGHCQELRELEARVREEDVNGGATKRKAGAAKRTRKAVGAEESSVLAGWLASVSIRSWASVEPSLADVDLRPYLFVAKDRKDYFVGLSVLGKLAGVVERLFGTKLSVQGMSAELRALPGPEATQVFDEVRSRITGKGTFKTQPSGMEGLVALATNHPHLEVALLDFLESLPTHNLGAWVVAGWRSAVKSAEGAARARQLLQNWSDARGNTTLSTAAAGALRTVDQS